MEYEPTPQSARSQRRLTELGTGNWNNRGIDNHIKRPAGVSSAGLKRMGMKRIDGIPHPIGCGNTSESMEKSLKYPLQCLVHNEHIYDGKVARRVNNDDPHDPASAPAGIEASKTVQFQNYAALSDKERDGADGGKVPSWLIGSQTKRRVAAPFQMNGDPIKHDFVKPHKVSSRPIRRMGPKGNDGPSYDNGAARLNWNLQKQQLNTGPMMFEGMTKEEWKAVSPRVHISPLGEVHTNIGGLEDMRPTCMNDFMKSDKPATLMTQYENDKRELAGFERDAVSKVSIHGRHVSVESPDMVKAMYYMTDALPSQASRSGYEQSMADRSCLDDGNSQRARSYRGSSAPSEISYRSGDPTYGLRPNSAPGPMSARSGSRQSPSMASFDQGRRRSGNRTPMSARGSGYYEASDRYERSIASSYYPESEGSRSRRSKSLDRFAGSQRRSDRSGYSETPMTGIFSDPSRTVTEQALNEALRSSRTLQGKSQRSPRKGR